jgi:hypothetical protein
MRGDVHSLKACLGAVQGCLPRGEAPALAGGSPSGAQPAGTSPPFPPSLLPTRPHSPCPSARADLMAARASPYALTWRSYSEARASTSPPSTCMAPSSSACSSCT